MREIAHCRASRIGRPRDRKGPPSGGKEVSTAAARTLPGGPAAGSSGGIAARSPAGSAAGTQKGIATLSAGGSVAMAPARAARTLPDGPAAGSSGGIAAKSSAGPVAATSPDAINRWSSSSVRISKGTNLEIARLVFPVAVRRLTARTLPSLPLSRSSTTANFQSDRDLSVSPIKQTSPTQIF